MADLVVYAYSGPGEQETAETLASALPAEWVVIAGRALPTPQKDDVDLMVIGINRVFTVEVKHWGPTIDVVNGGWRVKGELRLSPIGRNSQVSRIAASVLRQAVPGYKSASSGQHLVLPKVVLSYPGLKLTTTAYPYDDTQIELVHNAAAALLHADSVPTNFHQVRDKVASFLSGLSVRQERPTQLGPFSVETEVEGVGRARVFVGKDSDEDPIVLHAYPMDGWGPGVDVATLVRHERIATRRIADMQRAWSVEATISDEVRRWVVLPIRPVPSVALSRHAAVGQIPIRNDAGHLSDRALRIVTDAFAALAETHHKGVVHRGLSPSRVLIGKSDRVLLRDFYLAHASQEATIVAEIADVVDGSAPYRAPEVRAYIGAATPASDVYSMALSLLWWINGDVTLTEVDAIEALASSIPDLGPVTAVLASCIADNAKTRPTATAALDALTAIESPAPAPHEVTLASVTATSSPSLEGAFIEGGVIQGRYRLDRQIGFGGYATSWLATDTVHGGARVIKQYTNPDSTWAVRKEFEAAARLHNPRCARVWDCQPEAPVFLVSEYIDGQSLRAFGLEGTKDESDYRQVALDALEGLAYMHSEDQLHRDVSPNNIIVRDNGRAVLIDFGLSAQAKRAVSIAGTPSYIAPEVESSGAWTPAADLYALGVSMIRTMLSRFPYLSDGAWQVNKSQVQPLTEEEVATWGPSGAAVLNALFRLVEPDPTNRPGSASEFADFLRTVAGPKTASGTRAINPTVANLRRLYRGSNAGNVGNRGLDDDFARETYVPTRLDSALTPDVLAGHLDVVLLTGNPGDGKTAFLATLREELLLFGGTVEHENLGGWRIKTGNRTFAAVYDASEARDGKSSDELMIEALTGGDQHTALIAVNDGRLLSFFAAYSDLYPTCYEAVDAYAKGHPSTTPGVAIVDLKRRSLASTTDNDEGLAGLVLSSFTAAPLWNACTSCTARNTCPIIANRELLADAGRRPLLELVKVSHLRRKRRATFRDVRSAFAWTITGDIDCEDVHRAADEGRDLRLADNSLAYDLAFDEGNPDYLVAEWALVDPSILAAPSVERAIRNGSFSIDTHLRPTSHHRQLFFDGAGVSPVSRDEVRAYRYLDDFVEALADRTDLVTVKSQVLRGLSHILGAHGYSGNALALRDGESSGWSVLREIGAEEFTIAPVPADGTFVEQQSDGLRLAHRLGAMILTLDSFELVLRAADGEILGDAGAEAVKLELTAFGDLLRRNPARRVLVVDPAGRDSAVSVVDGVITREELPA